MKEDETKQHIESFIFKSCMHQYWYRAYLVNQYVKYHDLLYMIKNQKFELH